MICNKENYIKKILFPSTFNYQNVIKMLEDKFWPQVSEKKHIQENEMNKSLKKQTLIKFDKSETETLIFAISVKFHFSPHKKILLGGRFKYAIH